MLIIILRWFILSKVSVKKESQLLLNADFFLILKKLTFRSVTEYLSVKAYHFKLKYLWIKSEIDCKKMRILNSKDNLVLNKRNVKIFWHYFKKAH